MKAFYWVSKHSYRVPASASTYAQNYPEPQSARTRSSRSASPPVSTNAKQSERFEYNRPSPRGAVRIAESPASLYDPTARSPYDVDPRYQRHAINAKPLYPPTRPDAYRPVYANPGIRNPSTRYNDQTPLPASSRAWSSSSAQFSPPRSHYAADFEDIYRSEPVDDWDETSSDRLQRDLSTDETKPINPNAKPLITQTVPKPLVSTSSATPVVRPTRSLSGAYTPEEGEELEEGEDVEMGLALVSETLKESLQEPKSEAVEDAVEQGIVATPEYQEQEVHEPGLLTQLQEQMASTQPVEQDGILLIEAVADIEVPQTVQESVENIVVLEDRSSCPGLPLSNQREEDPADQSMDIDIEVQPVKSSSPALSPTAVSSAASNPPDEPISFERVLRSLASSSLDEERFHQAWLAKARTVGLDVPSRPLCDLTNRPAQSTLDVHSAMGPFLESGFDRQAKRREDDLEVMKSDYRELDKEWKAHCQRMEKIREKHQRKPIPHHSQLAPSALSAMGVLAPNTPAADLSLGFGGHDDGFSTPAHGFASLNSTPATITGRPSRRSGAAGAYGDAVRSEAEFLEILASLENADMQDPAIRAKRTAAVVPDLVVDPVERMLLAFDDRNTLVSDPVEFFGITESAAVRSDPSATEWTNAEVDIFCKRYSIHPKQFGKIAAHLPNKTLQQCILFYYRSKRTIDFRRLSDRRTKDGRKKKTKLASTNKGSMLLANLHRTKSDDEESPPASPRAAPTRGFFDISMRDNTGDSSTTSRIYQGNTRRLDLAAPPRGRKPKSKVQVLDPPSEGTMDAAMALAGLTTKQDIMQTIVSDAETEDAGNKSSKGVSEAEEEQNALKQSGPTARKRSNASSYWSVSEKTDFTRLLGIYGRNYALIAQEIPSKTATQCRNVSLFSICGRRGLTCVYSSLPIITSSLD